MKNVHVIARATASQRDAKTGEHQESVQWDELVIAVHHYFKELDSNFHDMKIMPIENEGNFALIAIKTLIKKCDTIQCRRLKFKIDKKLLISMEQGGRSMQIWLDENKTKEKISIENKDEIQNRLQWWGVTPKTFKEVYGNQTGLYSNLGNGEIIKQLLLKNKNTSCLIAVQGKSGHTFNKETCRAELMALDINRSLSNENGKLPYIVHDGLYVAFGALYYPAELIEINDKIMNITEAQTKVKKALNANDKCFDGRNDAADQYKAAECMQLLVLDMLLDKIVTVDPNDKREGKHIAEILFVNKIDGKDISWTVGLAETMKDQVKDDGNIVVLDVGSSSTKIFATSKIDGEWSDMEKLLTINGGDLTTVTNPTQ